MSETSDISLVLGVIIAGVPVGVLAQRLTLRVSLAREQLRLQRFMIGKKGYIAPKSPVLNHDADLFSVTCSLVCAEPHLSPNSSAAAWHDFSISTDAPAVAAYTGWYGNDGRQSVFLYGDPHTLLDNCTEIWDLGHVRKLTDTDTERYKHAVTSWKRIGLTPVALAYAPLPPDADPNHTQLKKLRPQAALLGLIGLSGSRGLGDTYSLSSSVAAQTAAHISLVGTVTIATFSIGSVLANRLLNIPIGITLSQIIALKLFVEPVILSSLSWDGRQKMPSIPLQRIDTAIKSGIVLAVVAYTAFLSYSYMYQLPIGGQRLRSASAVSILTLGLCMLTYIWWARQRTQNPLFLLALSSSLLGTLAIAYATGPLLLSELLIGLGFSLLYLLILGIYSYGERHYSRQHILDLLKTDSQK